MCVTLLCMLVTFMDSIHMCKVFVYGHVYSCECGLGVVRRERDQTHAHMERGENLCAMMVVVCADHFSVTVM